MKGGHKGRPYGAGQGREAANAVDYTISMASPAAISPPATTSA